MTRVRVKKRTPKSSGDAPERLPLRWALIIAIAVLVGAQLVSVGGVAAAIIGAITVAAALHKMLD